jgi:hypothetical protein
MAIRHDRRRPGRQIPDHSTHRAPVDFTDRILAVFDGVSTTIMALYALAIFLVLAAIVCWGLINLPALILLPFVLLKGLWPQSVAFWVTYPFAIVITAFLIWVRSVHDARSHSPTSRRGRNVLTAEEARRRARRELGSDDGLSTGLRRRR